MTVNNFDKALQQKIDALPKEQQPERDLWNGIAIGIERQSDDNTTNSRFSQRWPALAASVAIVACLSWFGIQYQGAGQQSETARLDATQLISALSDQHQAQKQALLVSYADQPALTQNWQQQLEELDDAANAIKAALVQDPNNTALFRMLQNVYQQQIDLIERVHAPKWQQI